MDEIIYERGCLKILFLVIGINKYRVLNEMICKLAGGLYSWRQPKSHKLHGGVWKQLSSTSPPPRFLDCVY